MTTAQNWGRHAALSRCWVAGITAQHLSLLIALSSTVGVHACFTCAARGIACCLRTQVAVMLNGQPMGGRRRSAYHFDLWCMKYLPKFKWEALTEEIGALLH